MKMAKKNQEVEYSQKFKEEKEIIDLGVRAMKMKHKLEMELLNFKRENNRIFHERELERGRIKNAEARKFLHEKNELARRG